MPYKDPEAMRAYQAAWHQIHKVERRTNTSKKRQEVRQEIRDLKERTPCVDCGKAWPYYVTDFDHREGEVKIEVVSKMALWYGREKVFQEIAKCDVVCTNCHRIRTHERRVRAQALLEGSSPT